MGVFCPTSNNDTIILVLLVLVVVVFSGFVLSEFLHYHQKHQEAIQSHSELLEAHREEWEHLNSKQQLFLGDPLRQADKDGNKAGKTSARKTHRGETVGFETKSEIRKEANRILADKGIGRTERKLLQNAWKLGTNYGKSGNMAYPPGQWHLFNTPTTPEAKDGQLAGKGGSESETEHEKTSLRFNLSIGGQHRNASHLKRRKKALWMVAATTSRAEYV